MTHNNNMHINVTFQHFNHHQLIDFFLHVRPFDSFGGYLGEREKRSMDSEVRFPEGTE